MHSIKRFLTILFLCGLLVPNSYARPDGPPDSDTTAPSGPTPPPPSADSGDSSSSSSSSAPDYQ